MKRLLLPICVILLAIVLISAAGGKGKTAASDAPRFTTVSEAAFSMRSSGSEDASSFLVGSFAGEKGEKLVFNGSGEVKRVLQNLSSTTGTYSLLQSADGASLLTLNIGGAEKVYAFVIASPDGGFTIRDADGNAETFLPVQ